LYLCNYNAFDVKVAVKLAVISFDIADTDVDVESVVVVDVDVTVVVKLAVEVDKLLVVVVR